MTTRYDIIIEANDKASKNIKAINLALKKTDTRATKAAKAIGSMGSKLGKVGFGVATGGMKSLAAATAVATAAFVVFGTKSINALDELGKISTKLGLSTKFLSEYASVAEKAGLSSTQFFTGVQRFKRRLGEAQMGAGELIKPLKALGIAIKDNNGNFRDGETVFKDYIAALGGMQNTDQALAFATKGFDTEGVAFINIAKLGTAAINELKQAARDAGQVVDDRLVRAAEDAKTALSKLVDIGGGFGKQFFGNLAAPLAKFADDLRDKIIEATEGAGGMEAFASMMAGKFLDGMAEFIKTVSILFDSFANTIQGITNALKQVLVALPDSVVDARFDVDLDVGGMRSRVEELKNTIANAISTGADEGANQANSRIQLLSQSAQQAIGALMNDIRRETNKSEPDTDFIARLQAEVDRLSGSPILATDNLLEAKTELARIQKTLDQIDSGEIIVFTQGARDAQAIEKATAGAVQYLRDAAKLRQQAAALPLGGRGVINEQPGDRATYNAAKVAKAELDILERLKAAHREYAFSRIEGDRMVAEEQSRISQLIGGNTDRLFKSREQANIQAKAYQEQVDAINKVLSESVSLTADQRYQLEAIRASYYEAAEGLLNYGENAELVRANTTGIAEALQRNRDKVEVLTELFTKYSGKLKQNGQDTDANKAIVENLTTVLEGLDEQYKTLTGTLDDKSKAMETVTEFMSRIATEAQLASNSTYNLATASAILTANLLAGRGDLEAQAAQLKIISDLQANGAPKGRKADKTPMQQAVERLENMREEARLNPIILAQLKEKYNLTRDEAEALGLVNRLSLTASQTMFKGIDDNIGKFNELESVLTNANAIEKLALKYGVSVAQIRDHLTEAQEGLLVFKNDTSTIAGNIADVWDQMGKDMADGISKGIMEGKGLFNSFKGFLKNFAQTVISQIIQKMLVQPMINQMVQFGSSLMGGMGGGGGGGMDIVGGIMKFFAGGFASGGNIPGGQFGLVGENGPEFINGPARITPMDNDINSSEGLTVNFNINAISTSDGTSFILEHKKEITGVIQNAFNKRGREGIY